MAAPPSERRRAPRADDPELRGRRAEPRAVIGLRTSAEMIKGRTYATLVDLSCTGAKLEARDLPDVGKDVLVTCEGIEIFGTVLWSDNGQCGICFDEPIGRQSVSDLRQMAAEQANSPISRDEIEAAADWLNGLAR